MKTEKLDSLPYRRNVAFFEVVFENGKKLWVAIDRNDRTVFVPYFFYPGGPKAAIIRSRETGDPLIEMEEGFLVRAEFALKAKPKEHIVRAINKLIEVANQSLEADRAVEGRAS